jgi:hypothetical protein
MSAGTQGWHACESISKRRLGIPGPNGTGTTDGAPFSVAVILRTAGEHEGHRSYWEWDAGKGSWMLLVLDERRSILGQVFGTTQAACHRPMNAIYKEKGFEKPYNGAYAPGGSRAADDAS